MSKGRSYWKLGQWLLLLALIGGLASCATEVATGPRAWIDFPRDGASGPPDAPVPVVCHASAPQGVAEVLLSVNGAPYRRLRAEPSGATFCKLSLEWLPPEPGLYTLQATAYDTTGAAGSPDTVTIRIGGAIPVEATDTPTPVPTTPTPTPTEPTPTPTAVTPTPTVPTPTPTVPTPTPTPFPKAEVQFWAEQENIKAGGCTVLHWDVEHASAVYLDGEGVGGHGTREVCPAKTITYQLHVEAPAGNVDRSVTVTVVAPPPDTTPPPVPAPQVPAEGVVLGCRSTQTLAWLPVTDPSGIAGYDVTLQRQVIAGAWKTVQDWNQVAGKQVTADVDCGLYYRWRVRAKDGAGNYSAWSAWAHFSVALP